MYVEIECKDGFKCRAYYSGDSYAARVTSDGPWEELKTVSGKVLWRTFAYIETKGFGFVYTDGEKMYRLDTFTHYPVETVAHEVDFKDWVGKWKELVAAVKMFKKLVGETEHEFTGPHGTKFKIVLLPEGDFEVEPITGVSGYFSWYAYVEDDRIEDVMADYMEAIRHCRMVMKYIRSTIKSKYPNVDFEVEPGKDIYSQGESD